MPIYTGEPDQFEGFLASLADHFLYHYDFFDPYSEDGQISRVHYALQFCRGKTSEWSVRLRHLIHEETIYRQTG